MARRLFRRNHETNGRRGWRGLPLFVISVNRVGRSVGVRRSSQATQKSKKGLAMFTTYPCFSHPQKMLSMRRRTLSSPPRTLGTKMITGKPMKTYTALTSLSMWTF